MLRDLPGKATLEPRHERGEGARQADILKSILGRRKRQCKGPEVWKVKMEKQRGREVRRSRLYRALRGIVRT